MVRPVNRISTRPTTTPTDAWTWAVRLLERWFADAERIDWLLESLPRSLSSGERARVQALLIGAVRNLGRIRGELERHLKRPPRAVVEAALVVAGFELLEAGGDLGQAAKVGHHLVERVKQLASAKEASFANAVVRKLATALTAETPVPSYEAGLEGWATFYSHPVWLVERWVEQWGVENTQRLLQTNQTPATVIVRERPRSNGADALPTWLQPLENVPGFYAADSGHWAQLHELIDAGVVHVQDAATRHAVDLLDPQPGETVLDLCAAPGGKSLAMADRMQTGRIVAFDMPGRRVPRLEESLQRAPAGVETAVVMGDLLRGGSRALAAAQEPLTYSAVLLDVPCSNTGVMRHRVDVRWRLQPESFRRHALQQLDLLVAAAERVGPGGRLVYSTCSIDREENEQVVHAFIQRSRGAFALESSSQSLPWETGHDGAAAFRLRRVN